ncbi:HAAS signaling domain-containing protein [Rummeliibacillus pycnus]|uniref:HAAS signaling domain-containing protein n=1 Tax=Rummeliibacillus pycnus TaxID=101070 RepID=UPI0037C81EE6
MNLIDIYIKEVTKRLPENNREDIKLELRSTIEDMLPDDYNEENVKAVLEKLGSPVTLASGYRDQPMHLIGPRYFDVYVTLLKMILPIAAVISLISMIAVYLIGYSGEQAVINIIWRLLGKGIDTIIEVAIQVFFWLTLVFAILERSNKERDEQPLTASLKKWTPDDLKNIPYVPKKKTISKGEVFGSLMWTAIWSTIYFYANHLVGVYERGRNGLELVTPTFNQEVLLGYWPIVLVVIGIEIALALYKLIKGQWTKGIAICNTAFELISTIVFIVILTNPNLMSQDFITYIADLFTITVNQFETRIVSGGISISILFAAISVFEGFRKAKIKMN